MPHREWKREFADHATDEVFASLDKFDPDRGALNAWAYLVARSSVFKHIRLLHVDRADVSYEDLVDEALPAGTGPEEGFVLNRLREAVAELEPEQRAAVEGFFFDGYSDVELAAQLGIPKRRVCYRRRQALKELRRRFGKAS
jgi:RNA polymerase sigma factor (sigma-70 family)